MISVCRGHDRSSHCREIEREPGPGASTFSAWWISVARTAAAVERFTVDWGPLLTAVTGATIALSGALVVEIRRDRGRQHHKRVLEHWRICVDFALALDAAHASLRDIARTSGSDSGRTAGQSVHGSGAYAARERLLMSASGELTAVAEDTFLKLIEVRNVVRSGAVLQSSEYHRAYHIFAEALWRFRLAVRAEFGSLPLTPRTLNRASTAAAIGGLTSRDVPGPT
jgi:hypothetical protein